MPYVQGCLVVLVDLTTIALQGTAAAEASDSEELLHGLGAVGEEQPDPLEPVPGGREGVGSVRGEGGRLVPLPVG